MIFIRSVEPASAGRRRPAPASSLQTIRTCRVTKLRLRAESDLPGLLDLSKEAENQVHIIVERKAFLACCPQAAQMLGKPCSLVQEVIELRVALRDGSGVAADLPVERYFSVLEPGNDVH